MSFNERHFQLFYGDQTSAPDGLVRDEKTPELVKQIIQNLHLMQAHQGRYPSKAVLEIINDLGDEIKLEGKADQAYLAFLVVIFGFLRYKFESDPKRVMSSHLKDVFPAKFFTDLSADFGTLPFVISGTDDSNQPSRHIDYSYASVFGKRFTLEIFDDEEDGDDEDPDSN